MKQQFKKFIPLTKVDEATHTVYGLAASEMPDKDNEVFDYAFGKEAVQRWSNDFLVRTTTAGQAPSLGNIRVMHSLELGGKAIRIDYKDAEKQIWIESEPVSEEVWQQLKRGILTGYSIGGGYEFKKPEGKYVRYGASIAEISLVDNPCNPEATFAYVKADGSMELRKFAPRDGNKVITDAAALAKQTASSFSSVLEKYNENHDDKTGEFTSGSGGNTGTLTYSHEGQTEEGKKAEDRARSSSKKADDEERNNGTGPKSDKLHEAAARAHERAAELNPQNVALHTLVANYHRDMKWGKAAEDELGKTRNPTGQFSVQNSGETHDFLISSGYTHDRVGSTQQHGIAVPVPIATYKSGSQVISVRADGWWEHDNGHEEHTTGTGLQDLKSHLELCMAAKAEEDSLDKTTGEEVPMTKEEAQKIQSMLKRFNLPFTVEHLERAAKGDGMTVAEEEALAEDMGVGDNDELDKEKNKKVISITTGKTVGEVIEITKARSERLRKGMYEIGCLANVLSELKMILMSSWYESAYETINETGGDEADRAICEALHEHMTGLVEVLKELVDEETEELLATPALKTAVSQTTKGDETSMKHIEELVKAAKGLAGHFKAAAAHHLKKAEHHESAAATHEAMAECHKAAHGHHKGEQATDLAKGMATHHSEMHKLHKAMTAHHSAMHKLHKAHAAHNETMASSMDEGAEKTEKLAATDAIELEKSTTDLTNTVKTGLEEVKNSFTGLGDLVKTTVTDALKDSLQKDETQVVKTTGLALVGRDGKKVEPVSNEGVSQVEAGL